MSEPPIYISLLGNAAQHTHSILELVPAISMHALLDLHTKLGRSDGQLRYIITLMVQDEYYDE